MNPIVHGEVGYLTGVRLADRRDRVLVTLAGVAPDLDGLSLAFGEDFYARYHHLLTHSIVAALAVGLIFGLVAKQKMHVFVLSLVAFHLHLICDLAGSGVGWPIYYLWPFGSLELSWSGGWELASWQNSTIGLAVTLLVLGCGLRYGRTMVELFSVSADAKVVAALRKRFGRAPPAT